MRQYKAAIDRVAPCGRHRLFLAAKTKRLSKAVNEQVGSPTFTNLSRREDAIVLPRPFPQPRCRRLQKTESYNPTAQKGILM